MKKLLVFIIIAMFLASSSMTVLAAKPDDKGGKCWTKKVKGVCPTDDSGDGTCPPGFIWLDLYEFCIKV